MAEKCGWRKSEITKSERKKRLKISGAWWTIIKTMNFTREAI